MLKLRRLLGARVIGINSVLHGYDADTMQNQTPTYVTDAQRMNDPKPDEAEAKLGSAQPNSDPFDAVAGTGPAGMPSEFVATERRPVYVVPVEALPIETQPTDFMTKEARPQDGRPREFRGA